MQGAPSLVNTTPGGGGQGLGVGPALEGMEDNHIYQSEGDPTEGWRLTTDLTADAAHQKSFSEDNKGKAPCSLLLLHSGKYLI